jgi:hypothetical protein
VLGCLVGGGSFVWGRDDSLDTGSTFLIRKTLSRASNTDSRRFCSAAGSMTSGPGTSDWVAVRMEARSRNSGMSAGLVEG